MEIIMAQSGNFVVRWASVKDVYFSKAPDCQKDDAVIAGFGNYTKVLGRYRNEEQCKRAIGYLYEAVKDGETAFEFPQAEDLPDCKANYGSQVKTKANRRGGS